MVEQGNRSCLINLSHTKQQKNVQSYWRMVWFQLKFKQTSYKFQSFFSQNKFEFQKFELRKDLEKKLLKEIAQKKFFTENQSKLQENHKRY